MVVEAQQTSKS
jgi:protein gp37